VLLVRYRIWARSTVMAGSRIRLGGAHGQVRMTSPLQSLNGGVLAVQVQRFCSVQKVRVSVG
jgi:hypothetical protein